MPTPLTRIGLLLFALMIMLPREAAAVEDKPAPAPKAGQWRALHVLSYNTDKDLEWILKNNSVGAEVRNVSSDYSLLAVQGPNAAAVVSRVTDATLAHIGYYWFCQTTCCGARGILARTGYTGEDGFEFYFPVTESENVWNSLLEAGGSEGLIPAGLGARNTLRLEAGMTLYGHELDEETTLLEADLGRICKFDKGQFVGREALLKQRQEGVGKKLVGFEMADRIIARDGYPVWVEGQQAGCVTSGSFAPFLKKNIGMAYLPPEFTELGREVYIEIRGRMVPARLVPLPFYKRNKRILN